MLAKLGLTVAGSRAVTGMSSLATDLAVYAKSSSYAAFTLYTIIVSFNATL